MVSIAHPHHDAARACRFSYVVDFGRKSHYRLFAIPDDGSPERVVAEMPVDKPAYMHSFAMTERYLVLTEFPLVVDPLRLMLAVGAVHSQLSLAAGARPALSRVRQGQRRPRRFARRPTRPSPSTTSMPTRKAPTSSSTSSPTTTPASSISSISRTCAPARRSTPPAG